jgi:alpha-1,6-mannosyltransferase
MFRTLHGSLCLAYLLVAAGAYVVAAQPDGTRGVAYMALHLMLAALMVAVWLAGRGDLRTVRAVVFTGIVAHVLLYAVPTFTSHDLQRYLWDGQALLAGLDPYRVAPADAAAWSTGWPLPPDNVDYPTLYPPGALALFAGAASLGPVLGPWAFRGVVLVAAVAVIVLGARLLRDHGAERHVALLALSPLLLLEAQVGTHVDVVATAALVTALVLYRRARWMGAGVALGLGGLVKLVPVVAVVPLALVAGSGGVVLALAAGGTMAAGYAAAMAGGLVPLGSLPAFAAKWEFGSPLYAVVSWGLSDGSARWALAGLGVAAGVAVVLTVRATGPWIGTRRMLVIPLLLSPVVFPWYLLPLVPLVALRPSATLVAWLAAVPLTYEVIDRFDAGQGWSPAAWPLACIAAAWGVGLAIDLIRGRSSAMAAAPRAPAPLAPHVTK